MGEVVQGPFITSLRTNPDRSIQAASEWELQAVVIIGFDKDGQFFFSSSEPDSGNILYLLEKAKHELMKMEDEMRANGYTLQPA